MARCQGCGRDAPTKYVEFYQNIGMLVLRQMRSVKGNLCRRCISKYFWQLTGLTLLTGWWGMISAIINPFVIINNIVRYVGSLGLADGGGGAYPVQPAARGKAEAAKFDNGNVVSVIDPLQQYEHDIRMRLRGGQTPLEIARFIAPQAGLTVATVQAYAERLKGS